MIPNFFEFLEGKPLYYKEIDYTRIHKAYALMSDKIAHPKAIHLIGTNGKGSTGRILAFLAFKSGLSVGHYSSPHILKFNERIWIDGKSILDKSLEYAHIRLYSILGDEMSKSLSYFEYTTLLALLIFEKCDLIVLEAGLGGEFDATNVIENKILTILTPIGIDHQAFLGDSIEEIATTKLRSLTPYTKLIVSPQPYKEVEKIAIDLAKERFCEVEIVKDKETKRVKELLNKEVWVDFIYQNASVALKALDNIGISSNLKDLDSLELFGRYYPISKNIRIDVGHNPLAAKALVKVMQDNSVLIYNSLDDKEYYQVLSILRPKIKRVELIKINSQRAVTLQEIKKALQELNIPWNYYNENIKEDENYLVFGSFYTVEAFLKSQKINE